MSQAPASGWRSFLADHWRDRRFWGWLWREQLSLVTKITLIGIAASGLVAAGVWAALSFSHNSSSGGKNPVLVPAGRTEDTRGRTASRNPPARAAATRSLGSGRRVGVAPLVKRVTSPAVSTNFVIQQRTVTNQQTILTQRTVTAVTSHSETLVRTQTVVATQTVVQTQTVGETVTVTVPVTVVETGTTGGG